MNDPHTLDPREQLDLLVSRIADGEAMRARDSALKDRGGISTRRRKTQRHDGTSNEPSNSHDGFATNRSRHHAAGAIKTPVSKSFDSN